MKQEFIPWDEAVALKELGFDEPCFIEYHIKDDETYNQFYEDTITNTQLDKITDELNEDQIKYGEEIFDYTYTAPLYQQAFRWFREKYGLISWIEGKKMFMYRMESPIESDGQLNCSPFITYEEAELECLKKLIEIGKREL